MNESYGELYQDVDFPNSELEEISDMTTLYKDPGQATLSRILALTGYEQIVVTKR